MVSLWIVAYRIHSYFHLKPFFEFCNVNWNFLKLFLKMSNCNPLSSIAFCMAVRIFYRTIYIPIEALWKFEISPLKDVFSFHLISINGYVTLFRLNFRLYSIVSIARDGSFFIIILNSSLLRQMDKYNKDSDFHVFLFVYRK